MMEGRNTQEDLAMLADWYMDDVPRRLLPGPILIAIGAKQPGEQAGPALINYAYELAEALPAYLHEQWARLARYRGALEHYADPEVWVLAYPGELTCRLYEPPGAEDRDGHDVAAQALGRSDTA